MPAACAAVRTGLVRLLEEPERWLRGRRYGLVTNAAARGPDGTPGFQLLRARTPELLGALFVPEHGLDVAATDGSPVPDGRLEDGVPVHSLYGPRLGPTAELLLELDLLVFDLQDVGVRFYTYLSTMRHCLRAAADVGLTLLVLDRPNPLGGPGVEGPRLRPAWRSFVGDMDVPVRHGLTLGELGLLARAEWGLPVVSLEVLAVEGWQRELDWAETGLVWYPPSPGARSLNMVRLYPGVCLVEGTNVSEGRGTDAPFELVGAPWLDGEVLARRVAAAGHGEPWPLVSPARFMPRSGPYAGQECRGIRLEAPARAARTFRSVAFGVALLAALKEVGGSEFAWRYSADEGTHWLDLLMGGPETRQAIEECRPWAEIAATWARGEREHCLRAEAALLYEGRAGQGKALTPLSLARNGGASAPRASRPAAALDLMAPEELAGLLLEAGAEAAAAAASAEARTAIATAIDLGARRLAGGGRLIYVGAGTSGRLGALDAAECEPTFGVRPGQVVGLVAGATGAVDQACEGAEDDAAAGEAAVRGSACGPSDVLVAVAASGTTPFTLAAMREGRRRGALCVAVTSAGQSPLASEADVAVILHTGSEPLLGSTRLKAGTAQKIALNALSTGIFSRLGFVHGNQMVGVQPVNAKLWARAISLVEDVAGVTREEAEQALRATARIDRRLAVRAAIHSLLTRNAPAEAVRALGASGDSLRRALEKGQ